MRKLFDMNKCYVYDNVMLFFDNVYFCLIHYTIHVYIYKALR